MTIPLIAVASLLIGYLLGRLRPVRRIDDWNWGRVIYGRAPNLGDVALFTVLHPGKALHAWRHRNEEPVRPTPTLSAWVTRAVDEA